MAGHSQFKNIMHRKGRQDSLRGKLFNKIAREIMVSCKAGASDPAVNPRLRAAMQEARTNNMPRERIERAIKAALPGAADAANYEEVRYEGYGPGGVALIVEALTDNRNRTAGEVRSAFSKFGGAMGEANSVSFMFMRCGRILYPPEAAEAERMLEAVIEAGGDDVVTGADGHEITTGPDDFAAVRDALEAKFGAASSAGLTWKPQNLTPAGGADAANLVKLLDALNDNDDVQNVIGNFDIALEELERLTG